MSEKVMFYCPKHGPILETFPGSRVQHNCGEECAPEGEDPAEHKRRYQTQRRVKRYRNTQKPQ